MLAGELTCITGNIAEHVGIDARFERPQRGSLEGIVTGREDTDIALECARRIDDGRA